MSNAPGKRPLTVGADEKARMRAEGWRFSGDAATPQPAATAADDDDADLMAAVCQSGGLAAPKVISALLSAARPVETKARACLAIATLAENDQGRKIVLTQGGVDAVIGAMRGFTQEAALAANGCAALANLALGDGEAAVRAGQGIEATLEAMAAHAARAEVQAKGCLALTNLSFSSEGEAQVLGTAGFVAALATSLKAASASAAVAEEASDCIANCAGSVAGLAALDDFAAWGGPGTEGGEGRQGLLEALRALREAHPQCASVGECISAIEAAATTSVACPPPPSPTGVVARSTPRPPSLEGRDTLWDSALVIIVGCFHSRSGRHRPHVEARLLHDAEHLYVRFEVSADDL